MWAHQVIDVTAPTVHTIHYIRGKDNVVSPRKSFLFQIIKRRYKIETPLRFCPRVSFFLD